jgi:Cys-tRNA(Pro)/Cys-tRNA(Cys) deacylase
VHEFEHEPSEHGYGLAAAHALGVDPIRVFKTLLAEVDGRAVVGIVPVTRQLSLKELAVAVDGKRAQMMDTDRAQRLTGYVVGGISPFGQKRSSPTVIDDSAHDHETVFVNASRNTAIMTIKITFLRKIKKSSRSSC